MSVIYKSTSSSTVTAGQYAITADPGLQLAEADDALDKLVGVSLTRTYESALELSSKVTELVMTVPVIIPNSATVATNGGITVTALPATYSDGAWVYLPADAVVDGLAGFYWTVFSSATAGSVKTNYVDPSAEEFLPYTPTGTLTAVVGSNAAFVTPTGADVIMVNITVPANSLPIGSTVKMFSRVTCPSAANDKIVTHKLGTTSIGSYTFTESTGGTLNTAFFNRTRAKQILGIFGDSAVAATTFGTVNTAAATNLVIAGQLEATTGYLVLEAACITKSVN